MKLYSAHYDGAHLLHLITPEEYDIITFKQLGANPTPVRLHMHSRESPPSLPTQFLGVCVCVRVRIPPVAAESIFVLCLPMSGYVSTSSLLAARTGSQTENRPPGGVFR